MIPVRGYFIRLGESVIIANPVFSSWNRERLNRKAEALRFIRRTGGLQI